MFWWLVVELTWFFFYDQTSIISRRMTNHNLILGPIVAKERKKKNWLMELFHAHSSEVFLATAHHVVGGFRHHLAAQECTLLTFSAMQMSLISYLYLRRRRPFFTEWCGFPWSSIGSFSSAVVAAAVYVRGSAAAQQRASIERLALGSEKLRSRDVVRMSVMQKSSSSS